MKVLAIAVLSLLCSAPAWAQTAENEPASSDDVILFLRTMHSHDMMQKTMDAMLKPMHQMFHDSLGKDSKTLPPDAEKRFNKAMDELIQGMPIDEMTQAMIPVYQKHFTKSDIQSLNAFYSSPTGQKVLEEMPAVTGESMQAMMPVMRKYIDQAKERMQQEVKEIEKDSPPVAQESPSAQK